MRIKKGDMVMVISGDDKGREGKVIKVMPKKQAVLVEGLNIQKKHQKPKREGEKGQIVEKPGPIHISNVKLVCSRCGKATRVSRKIVEGKKHRVCKKCGQVI